ncbi:MAG: hypothetical protein ABIO04_12380 [Ferruginibacter sp.]
MSETQLRQEYKPDDLDLVRLLERIYSFFRNYGKLLVAFSILGVLSGFVLYKVAPKVYGSSMLLHSFTLSNTEQIKIIETWNDLLKNKEYKVLAKRLHCEPKMLENVRKLSAMEIQKLYIPNNPNGFMVEALVKDNNVLDSLGKGIVYGLETTEYIKAKLDARRSTLLQLIDKVRSEIIKLDSTKRNIEYSINNNNQHSSSYIIDVSGINIQMIGLNEKLLGYLDELKFTNAVQVLQNFEKFRTPVAPKLLKSLLLGLIGGLALGYFLSLYLYVRKRVTEQPRF